MILRQISYAWCLVVDWSCDLEGLVIRTILGQDSLTVGVKRRDLEDDLIHGFQSVGGVKLTDTLVLEIPSLFPDVGQSVQREVVKSSFGWCYWNVNKSEVLVLDFGGDVSLGVVWMPVLDSSESFDLIDVGEVSHVFVNEGWVFLEELGSDVFLVVGLDVTEESFVSEIPEFPDFQKDVTGDLKPN